MDELTGVLPPNPAEAIVDQLLRDIGPKTVLDLGSVPPLTDVLRARGIDVARVDHPAVGPLAPHVGPSYDLIISIGGLDHLTAAEHTLLVAQICASAPEVILSSDMPPPVEAGQGLLFSESPRSLWPQLFARHGFFLDIDYDASFVAPLAMRFRRLDSAGPTASIFDELSRTKTELDRLRRVIEERDQLILSLHARLLRIETSVAWKASRQLRSLLRRLLGADSERRSVYWVLRRTVHVFMEEGLVSVLQRVRHKIHLGLTGRGFRVRGRPSDLDYDLNAQYQLWLQSHPQTESDLDGIGRVAQSLSYRPLISILTPVYETDEALLRSAIDSVRSQAYEKWQLCLVNDGSQSPHVRVILDEYAALDPRVRVKHLLINVGTAEASNHALQMAQGEFVGLLDHDDELSPNALFEVAKLIDETRDLDLVYSDEDKIEPGGGRREPFFKPDWSPDLLLSMNYITHFVVLRRSLLTEIGGFRRDYEGSQDYDLLLRFTERTDRIAHIPKILYHWRKTAGSAALSAHTKPYAHEAGRRALEDALRRRGTEATVDWLDRGLYRVRYKLQRTPLVSIIIPTRDAGQLVQQCLHSIEHKTSYKRYEVIILDNESSDPATLRYLEAIAGKHRVHRFPGAFNFSAINNLGASQANGEYLLFLNNDVQVIRPDWLTAMLEQAQRPEVGAVGARLLYPDGRIQHAGLVVGPVTPTRHAFRFQRPDEPGYHSLADVIRNCSAVTGACLMVRRRVFEDIGGFDPRFKIAYNDVDLCLRLRSQGHLIVYTPFALLYHHESATRGTLHPLEEEGLYWKLWGEEIGRGDPYYNPNLTPTREDWSLDLRRHAT
jgi:GT2 family glycosyltransferase